MHLLMQASTVLRVIYQSYPILVLDQQKLFLSRFLWCDILHVNKTDSYVLYQNWDVNNGVSNKQRHI